MIVEAPLARAVAPARESLRKLVQKHVLRITLDALIRAEWESFRESLSPAAERGEERCATRKVHTDLGHLRVQVPQHDTIKFRSALLDRRQRVLKAESALLLPLPFLHGEKLQLALKAALSSEVPVEGAWIERFHRGLSRRFSELQEISLQQEWSEIHFGSVVIDEEGVGALDYCITVDPSGHESVAGIWDADFDQPGRWREICDELEGRGMRRGGRVLTDDSAGTIEAHFRFGELTSELAEENEEPALDETEILADEEPLPTVGGRSPELRSHLALFDVDEDMDEEELPSPEDLAPAVDGSYSNALAPLLVAALVVTTGFFYFLRNTPVGDASPLPLVASAGMASPPVQITMADLAAFAEDPSVSDKLLYEAISAAVLGSDENRSLALSALANHSNYRVRIQVIKALSARGPLTESAHLDAIIARLHDVDYLVRGHAAKALGSIATPRAIEALRLRQGEEEDDTVQKVIAKALGNVLS